MFQFIIISSINFEFSVLYTVLLTHPWEYLYIFHVVSLNFSPFFVHPLCVVVTIICTVKTCVVHGVINLRRCVSAVLTIHFFVKAVVAIVAKAKWGETAKETTRQCDGRR